MNATKIMWAFLLNYGHAGTPSFYGGWEGDEDAPTYDEMIRIGIDWKKTREPESDKYSSFQGTFCEASYEEMLTGKLHLKNGKNYIWSSTNCSLSDFMSYIKDLIEIVNTEAVYKD